MQTRQEALLRSLVKEIILREVVGGSTPEEKYDRELLDDPAWAEGSVLVPDDIKDRIGKWARAMGLHTGRKGS